MRRKMFIAVLLIAAMALPAVADEMELGISVTPVGALAEAAGDFSGAAEDEEGELLTGFQIGYRFLGLLYGDWTATVLPPPITSRLTSFYDEEEQQFREGPPRPGFLNTFNFGAKIALGPFVGFSTIGVNSVYVHNQAELDAEFQGDVGANFRFGFGLRGASLGVNLSIMGLFPDVDTMFSDLEIIFGDDERLAEQVANKIPWLPSLTAVLYL